MDTRIPYRSVSPEGYKAFGRLHQYVAGCGLEPSLIELVYLRISRINGCAYGIDLHWHEAPFSDEREWAALARAESLTLVAQTHAPDEVYQTLVAHFSEKKICDLTYAAATINAFNRLAIGHRLPVSEHV